MKETRCNDCAVGEDLHAELASLLTDYSLDDEHRRAILEDARKRRPRPPRRLPRGALAAAAVLLAVGAAFLVFRDREEAPEAAVFTGPLAHVTIEQTLYETAEGSGLYLRLTIWNPGPREIGVDLEAYADLLHRGEWSRDSNDHQRRVLAMRFGQASALPPERRDRVLREFEAGGLFAVAPGGSVDIYRKFNSSRERKINTPNGTYLAIGANPILLVTDGDRAELITTSYDESSQRAMNRLAKRGIDWAILPDGAFIIPIGE